MLKSIVKSLLFLSLFGLVYGFIIPNYEGYVTDTVGVFSETQKADITTKIEAIEKTTSIEIAILVVPTVDDDINLATVDVGNQWGVGKKGQDNGLIVLIAIDDRKYSLQVGYGLEGTLPDLATKQIGDARFPPNFRNGDYYQGIIEMLDDVSGYIQKDPTIVQTYSQPTQQSSGNTFNEKYMLYAFVLVLVLLSSFGRWITVPSSTGKGRKMRKKGRFIYTGVGLVLSGILFFFLSTFIISLVISYVLLLFGILMGLYSRPGNGPIWFGGGGSGFGGGGSSFGGFGGGSFGGGGSS
ncbi:MAG: TPM domain-containing protein, partial [candidate division SR1 bacterium]|nr:TPM domain-containing protein [candidate division SR1 bacterium]